MAELEKNPEALRQGAAAVVCVAVAATAMPVISHRAAEQRADAQWASRAASFQKILLAEMEAEVNGPRRIADQAAVLPLTLASYNGAAGAGYKVAGAAPLEVAAVDDLHMIAVRAGLRDQAALQGFSPFQPARLAKARAAAKEQSCLAQAIYYEARSESLAGQEAVAEVVLNRVKSRHYPDSVCEVVFEGSWRSTGCQFTFTCDGALTRKPKGEAWRRANLVAKQALMGISRPVTHRATHYHTVDVAPVWSASLIETTRIGAHIFYRFPNRRERAQLFAERAAPNAEPDVVEVAAPELDEAALDPVPVAVEARPASAMKIAAI